MRLSRGLRLAIVIAGSMVMPAPPVAAVSSVTSGWWTTASTPVPPDVPPDGLLVQSTINPSAYAAASFVLDPAERPEALTLTVAPGAASNPVTIVRVCPLTERFEPERGGAADAAPAYDCTQFVDASPTAGAYVFDVSKLPATGTLAVALLPTGPLDRVVFERPDAGSLSTTRANAPTEPPVNAPVGAPPSNGEPFLDPPFTARPDIGALGPPPPTPASPGLPPAADAPGVAGSSLTGVSSGTVTSGLAQALLAAALGVGLVLWLISGKLASHRAERPLHDAMPS